MTSKDQVQAAAYSHLASDLSVICNMLGLSEYVSLGPVMERLTELMSLAGGNEQEKALLIAVEDTAKQMLLSTGSQFQQGVSSEARASLLRAITELAKQRVLWSYLTTNLDLKSEDSIANFLLDAIRYRVLRDQRNQLHEDDACVRDSTFTTYFGKNLDRVADAMCRRNIELTAVQDC